ncbi:hypothetical protein FNU79_01100 [Deinococcus detaillensis]|uniref:DUF1453 domain-containing protein n=1 Tax=Deinococcus detaillensis TaxID=2592048 RepID=A0A553V615_9DEIO|nr:hypothetical protein [Deinococcus detaillensis]TSA87876.1 hypothetical protein FNU79_01100 [Deinococcus detaillensis]
MTAAVHPSVWPLLGGGLLVVWMLIRRFRFTVGPQLLDARGRRRLLIRSLILGALLLATLIAPHTLASYGAGAAGLLIGAGLASWSLHHTRFERDAAGEAVRYVPNVWIGAAVFGLFVVRLLWRVVPIALSGQFYNSAGNSFDPGQFNASSFTSGSPLTYALFAVFVAYQMAYAFGVLRQTKA